MKCIAIACALAVASAAPFTISTVPSRAKELSSDEVSVQLQNAAVTSPYFPMGAHFKQGLATSTDELVSGMKSLPTQLRVKANGWNGLNFITVRDGSCSPVEPCKVAQFKTDFFNEGGVPHHDGDVYFYDQVFSSDSGAPLAEATRDYTVQYRTGWHAEAGSSSPMYVQFRGSNGSSQYYLLGNTFSPGQVGKAIVKVSENIGNLQGIELMAGGPDSWNCVNFIEVKTPANEWIQFETNVFLDQLPGKIKIGVYPHSHKKAIDAVNVEGTSSKEATYQVSLQTGDITNANSNSPQFVQLRGDLGRSNYIKLGEEFKRGQRSVIDVVLRHDIGLLKSIKLQAGGTDGWLVVGDFSVKTPADAQVHFQTDFFMDEKPHDGPSQYGKYSYFDQKEVHAAHPEPPRPCTARGQHNCCGNGICDATEDTGNCARDCKNSGWESLAWGNQEKPEQVVDTPTAEPVKWQTHENKQQWKYTGSQENALTTTVKVGEKAAPTPSPTLAKDLKGCTPPAGHCETLTTETQCNLAVAEKHNGCEWTDGVCKAKTLPHGWTMAGTKENYCNYCKCNDGQLTCSNRVCGLPITEGEGWSVCDKSHISCRAPAGRLLVRTGVHADKSVASGKHACAFNEYTKDCTCMCQLAATGFNTGETGKHDIAQAGFVGKHCEVVAFKKPFDSKKGDVTVIVSASHSNAGSDYTHDAPVVWVEEARSSSFTVCAREDRKYWNSYNSHSHRLNVEYYAFQGQRLNHDSKLVKDFNKPFPGAHFDTTAIPARSQAGTQCHTIGFGGPRPFDRVPIVVGSVDYKNFNEATNGHDAVAHWIDNVNTNQFRVCFIETEFTMNTDVDAFNFNWMAVEHRNPELFEDNQISYKAAGHVPTKGLWRAARADRESKGTVACKEIKYERPFGSTKPTVFVEGVHEKPGLDWAHADDSPATITYVNKVLPDRFEVCSTAMNQNQATDTSDEQLVWNWIAFAQ